MKKILIAEDEQMLLISMAFFLEKKGYSVTQVPDGNVAIEEVRKNKFDLIVTDLYMPFADGMEVVNVVRNELKLTTPIIVLTADGQEQVELNALEIGASEFLKKPFSIHVLAARIDKMIQTK